MKFFLAIALVATVASAAYVKPTAVVGELAEIQEIVAAINSPSTNPATAAALEQMLLDVLGVQPEPVAVGPAVIEAEPIAVGPAVVGAQPIAVGPAFVDVDPLPEAAVVDTPVAAPSPVVIGPIADGSSAPLVQIILNINQAAAESTPAGVAPSPAVVPESVEVSPVHVVEVAPVQVVETAPVQVVETAPVQVVETAPVQVIEAAPVQVIEAAPVPVEPVVIGTPVLPSPAVVLPEELN